MLAVCQVLGGERCVTDARSHLGKGHIGHVVHEAEGMQQRQDGQRQPQRHPLQRAMPQPDLPHHPRISSVRTAVVCEMHYSVSMPECDLLHYKHNSQPCLHVHKLAFYSTVVLRSSDKARL